MPTTIASYVSVKIVNSIGPSDKVCTGYVLYKTINFPLMLVACILSRQDLRVVPWLNIKGRTFVVSETTSIVKGAHFKRSTVPLYQSLLPC